MLLQGAAPGGGEETEALNNRIVELEDEKGNLQLKLVDLEETVCEKGEGQRVKECMSRS